MGTGSPSLAMSDLLLGACLGLAAWFILQMFLAAALQGKESTITLTNVAISGALAVVFLFVAVLTYVGVL